MLTCEGEESETELGPKGGKEERDLRLSWVLVVFVGVGGGGGFRLKAESGWLP